MRRDSGRGTVSGDLMPWNLVVLYAWSSRVEFDKCSICRCFSAVDIRYLIHLPVGDMLGNLGLGTVRIYVICYGGFRICDTFMCSFMTVGFERVLY